MFRVPLNFEDDNNFIHVIVLLIDYYISSASAGLLIPTISPPLRDLSHTWLRDPPERSTAQSAHDAR